MRRFTFMEKKHSENEVFRLKITILNDDGTVNIEVYGINI